jgi:hypothetical protein
MTPKITAEIAHDQIYTLIATEAQALYEEARFGVGISLEKATRLDIMARAEEIHRLAVLLSK